MIGEFEQYHGAAIRDLIVNAPSPLSISACDEHGRINSYKINGDIGLYIKHSSKRLPPWQFVYSDENCEEIRLLLAGCRMVWLLHVCGRDGVVAISNEEFDSINSPNALTTSFVRVDRDRNTMYRVNGTSGKLARPKARGIGCMLGSLQS